MSYGKTCEHKAGLQSALLRLITKSFLFLQPELRGRASSCSSHWPPLPDCFSCSSSGLLWGVVLRGKHRRASLQGEEFPFYQVNSTGGKKKEKVQKRMHSFQWVMLLSFDAPWRNGTVQSPSLRWEGHGVVVQCLYHGYAVFGRIKNPVIPLALMIPFTPSLFTPLQLCLHGVCSSALFC